jgi:hypothetical protein
MGDPVRVMVEHGKKKRDVATAFDWPGWVHWTKRGGDVLAVLESYRPRYARVAELAGYGDEFAAAGDLLVVEDLEGTGMSDFYGTSGRTAQPELEQMSDAECERKIALLRASWAYLDSAAARAGELRLGPRGGGRDRDRIVRHVNGAEIDEMAPKVGVKVTLETRDDPEAMRAYRDAFADGIREANARGPDAGSWTVQFLIRRAAYHMLDHAWEIEDRDMSGDGASGSNAS